MKGVRRLWGCMSRRQPSPYDFPAEPAEPPEPLDDKMKHVLSLVDLTLLGVGSTLGTGVYILAGQVASQVAGPAVVLSFFIAAAASLLAALCYAELAATVPTSGTAYSYSYVAIGEFPAFFVGWNLLMEFAIATAGVSQAFSNYVDAVTGNAIRTWSVEHIPMQGYFLAEFPGFLALGFVTLLAMLLAFGAKESSLFNNVCTFFNMATIIVTVVAGSCKSNTANWHIAPQDVPEGAGRGGFLPFGVNGVLTGASKCFFGYVGFDTITSCGSEARNPKKSIPLSIMLTLLITFTTYLAVSVVATMMVPYYEQDVNTPFPSAFQKVGLTAVSWVVTIGAMFAMCTSLVGSMFPLPRVMLTMAGDGMVFRSLAKICPSTGTSVRSTLAAWFMSGSMALLFNLEQLIDLMSIGTLTAYIVVAMSVVQIRYRINGGADVTSEGSDVSCSSIWKAIVNYDRAQQPSTVSTNVVTGAQLCYLTLCIPGTYLLSQLNQNPTSRVLLASIGVIMTLIFLVTICVALQPCATNGNQESTFRTPFVPFLPYLSILLNMFLMMEMSLETWARFSTWLLMGFILYFWYSIKHSSLAQSPSQRDKPQSQTPSLSSVSSRVSQ